VNDFDNYISVAGSTADKLTLSIGEPQINSANNNYELTDANTRRLPRTSSAPPVWGANLTDLELQTTYCLEVYEDEPQTTRTLTCRSIPPPPAQPLKRIDMTGVLLRKSTLDEILVAISTPPLPISFPRKGLVVGLVLNSMGMPASGAVVQASCMPACSVQYLSADRKTLNTMSTSSNGIWISQDAPYPATFSRAQPLASALGGLVDGKVTIVILQESTVGGG
jgi:hypothetical protein